MPTKADTRFTVEVDGVRVLCRAEKNMKVTVNVDKPKVEQYKVAIRKEETRETAVARAVALDAEKRRRTSADEQTGSETPADSSHHPDECLFSDVDAVMRAMNSNAAAADDAAGAKPRKRRKVERLDPGAQLSEAEQHRMRFGRGDGSRWRRSAGPADSYCQKEECIRVRAEHARFKRKSEEDAAAIRRLRDLLDSACDGLDTQCRVAVQHIQHALMELLDEEGEEEGEDEGEEGEEGLGQQADAQQASGQLHQAAAAIPVVHDRANGMLALCGQRVYWAEQLGTLSPSLVIPVADIRNITLAKVGYDNVCCSN